MSKSTFKTRQDKIDFLKGLKNGTRAIDEITELEVIFTDKAKYERARQDKRYAGKTIFYIPDNGRCQKPNPDNSPEKNREP